MSHAETSLLCESSGAKASIAFQTLTMAANDTIRHKYGIAPVWPPYTKASIASISIAYSNTWYGFHSAKA